MKKLKEMKGITLIALVITIIVLLILAGVSIATLTGENGILTQATNASKQTEITEVKERAKLDILDWKAGQLKDGKDAKLTVDKIKEILGTEKAKEYVGTVGEDKFTTKSGYEILYSELDSSIDTFNPATLEIGEAINPENYGKKVTNYNVKTEETGGWRLFYQDSNYTYLISDNCIGPYIPDDYSKTITSAEGELKYQTGKDVSIVGQRLSKMLLEKGTFFVEDCTNSSIRAVAWLTDTSDTSMWAKYNNSDTVFAIGTPTFELYKASFDATAKFNNASTFSFSVDNLLGYAAPSTNDILLTSYSKGIYNKDVSTTWWIASPENGFYYTGCLMYINAAKGSFRGREC